MNTIVNHSDDNSIIQKGSGFIELQTKTYASYGINVSHIYNIDTYNEVNPSSNDPNYLNSAGAAVYNSLIAADPDAVWLMQVCPYSSFHFINVLYDHASPHRVGSSSLRVTFGRKKPFKPIWVRCRTIA